MDGYFCVGSLLFRMPSIFFSSCYLLLLFVYLLALPGCSTSKDGTATELQPEKDAVVDGTEDELLQKGKEMYAAGRYVLAKDTFHSLRQAFPLGPYAEFADIKAADSQFALAFYDEAAVHYEEILKDRPSTKAADYILLMAGRSNQLANKGTGRDPKSLERARQFYERLIREYPSSMYADTAKNFLTETLTSLAEHHEQVLDYYSRSGNEDAYETRKKEFEQEWLGHLARVEEEEDEDDDEEEKQEQEQEGDDDEKEPGSKKKRDVQLGADPEVLKIECREQEDGKLVSVYLDRPVEDLPERIQNTNNFSNNVSKNFLIRLGNSTGKEVLWNCFEPNDIRLRKNGDLEITSSSTPARVFTELKPSRLHVLLKAAP